MILKIVIALVLIALLCVIINGIEKYCKVHNTSVMSFKESMDLTELPIVTFYNNGNKLNFLLDTGANTSVINHSALSSTSYKKEEGTGTLFGMEGNKIEVCYVTIPLEYKDKVYEDHFQVVDMSQSFNQIKSESGVTLHGVLGSMFFQKYQYVLDFKSLIAYSKKQ